MLINDIQARVADRSTDSDGFARLAKLVTRPDCRFCWSVKIEEAAPVAPLLHEFGRACFAPRVGERERIELPACGGVELGAVRGRGLDELPVATQASFLWVAPALAQGLWFSPIERVGIGAQVQLAVPLNRGSFAIDTIEVQRVAAVSVRGLAGIELRG